MGYGTREMYLDSLVLKLSVTALTNEVPIYNALTNVQSECLQLFRLLDVYLKHRTATMKLVKSFMNEL